MLYGVMKNVFMVELVMGYMYVVIVKKLFFSFCLLDIKEVLFCWMLRFRGNVFIRKVEVLFLIKFFLECWFLVVVMVGMLVSEVRLIRCLLKVFI